jgi:predicted phosphodiesterase
MRVLIISDIHANLTALETVLSDAGEFDAVWCLGDLVGYGPDPNECIARIKEQPDLLCIIGNHDAAVLDNLDPYSFNTEAREAIEWTKNALSESSLFFLRSLPEKTDTSTLYPDFNNQVTLAHGSPRQPVWEYLLDIHTATQNFNNFNTAYCFVGHTHLPIIFHYIEERGSARPMVPEPGHRIQLSPRAIINPGSVGQPRDRDPRASYMLYDPQTEIIEYRRVVYDIQSVQERMRKAGLPQRHIRRLEAGW